MSTTTGAEGGTTYGLCAECHRAIGLVGRQVIASHGPTVRCPGSGQPPARTVTLDHHRAQAMVTGWLDGLPAPPRASVSGLVHAVSRLLAEGADATATRRTLDAWLSGGGRDAGKLRRYAEAPNVTRRRRRDAPEGEQEDSR